MRLFHKHKWTDIQMELPNAVRSCRCGQFQTLLYDRSDGLQRWIDGYFVSRNKRIVIFAGNQSQFRFVEKQILDTTSAMRNEILYASEKNLRGLHNADVYFFGTWWDNPDYQSDSVTFLINGLLNL